MPFFTRCNISLGCPQNVSEVSAQNTTKIIYYNVIKCHFWGVSKKELFRCVSL